LFAGTAFVHLEPNLRGADLCSRADLSNQRRSFGSLSYDRFECGGVLMKMKIAALGAGALLLAAAPMLAHHSFSAEYDQTKPLTLTGKFVKIDWVNPHSWVHFDVTGPDGKVTHWAAETPPPNGLYRDGWRKDYFEARVGEEIQVTGVAAKDGTPHMWSNGVTFTKTGTRFTMGSRSLNEGPTPDSKGK